MRKLFPAYYKPSNEEFDQLWNESVFVFDTNVLLKVYQLDENLRKVLVSLFEQLAEQNRLWIPYQAALEYHKNMHGKILGQETALDQAFTEKDGLVPLLKGVIARAKIFETHPIVSHKELCGVVEETISKIEKLFDKGDQLTRYKEECETLSLKMSAIFDGRVGLPFDEETLNKKRKEADDRYKDLVPPGYMDKKEKEKLWESERANPSGIIPGDPFGDALIWFQMIEHAKVDKRSVIFTTDDAKADWWYYLSKRKIGPRPELRTEMRVKGGVDFHMYDLTQFVKISKKYFKFPTGSDVDAAISESKRIAEARESFIHLHPVTRSMLTGIRNWRKRKDLESDDEVVRDLLASALISKTEYIHLWQALNTSKNLFAGTTPHGIDCMARAVAILNRAMLMDALPPSSALTEENDLDSAYGDWPWTDIDGI